MTKVHANKGVRRNKKPLKNLVYEVEVNQLKSDVENKEQYDKYKFKDEGYLVLLWKYEGSSIRNWHGFVTPQYLKELLGEKQWAKFCEGKRQFVKQRRINGKNI